MCIFQSVSKFYEAVVAGKACLSDLGLRRIQDVTLDKQWGSVDLHEYSPDDGSEVSNSSIRNRARLTYKVGFLLVQRIIRFLSLDFQ